MNKHKLKLFTDGAARGNPGPAGAGAYLCDAADNAVAEVAEYLGTATNNVAEYQALIFGLKKAIELKVQDLDIYADSELMIKQIKGVYKVKNEGLKPLHKEAKSLLSALPKYTISHVRREYNKEADRLANEAIDAVH